jgi:hypothetical protein
MRFYGRSIFCLVLLLALLARSAVPAGFMPAAPAPHEGARLALTICTASGLATVLVDAAKYAPGGQKQEKGGHHHDAACPFAPVLAQDMPLTLPPAAQPQDFTRAAPRLAAAPPPYSHTPKNWFAQGPPAFSTTI